ncbi:MAG: proline dehydrogenase family protein [Thermodesulfovibrionales bacterium]|jgi:RHH-type proline utilization regulon transcriptional repressor/proline dehydrogenase/delta 1-pyrroline-5-carboxylate dehydrogenase
MMTPIIAEERVREIGLEIYAHIEHEIPSLFDKKRWMGRLLEWTMRDETFKIQLFRFIDALPSLKTDALVVRLLQEYFPKEINLPEGMRWGFDRISRMKGISFISGKAVKAGVGQLARQFIAGRDAGDALRSLEALRKTGVALSIDLLGEAVVSDREARQYTERYVSLLSFLSQHNMSCQEPASIAGAGCPSSIDISLKISSFYSQLDPMDWEGSIAGIKEGLRKVFEKARELHASITFDMEHSYYKDLTITVFQRILEEFKDSPSAGIALQAYLKDTKEDLLKLISWAKENRRPITVRLVKGAYWDYEITINRQKGWPLPVFLDKGETDHAFEELTRILLENADAVRPAIATHNVRSISHAIAVAESLHLSNETFEFQMLYGMAEPLRKALRKMNHRVKVYTPVGELIPGMAYLVRRLLENTSDESFLRESFSEKIPFEVLISPPHRGGEIKGEKTMGDAFKNEPPLDFSLSQNREKMTDALKKIRGEFGRRYPLYLGGKDVVTGKEMRSLNPAMPEEIVGTVSAASETDGENALAAARAAWDGWRKVPANKRADYLFKAAVEMRKRRFELAALEVYEVGKTWKDADGDITEAVDYLEYYGREIMRFGTVRHLGDYPGEENYYEYEPRGVGVVISPWNFPLAIPTGMVSAAVVAGNCVIFKPSGLSPVMGWKLVEIFRTVGLPPGVIQFLPGTGAEVGEYLVSHPTVDFIAFTGSKDVGLAIIKRASEVHPGQRNVKRVIAEMGGKNAIIIDETADFDDAIKGVLESAFVYQGQKCSACSKVIVIQGVFDEFSRRLREATESLPIGPPEEPGSFMGPVADEGALSKIEKYIQIGKRDGKAALIRKAKGEGYFVGPAIFTDISPDSPVLRDEIFGPVLALLRAQDIDEAIKIAHSTPYALTGGLFSRSPRNIRKVKDDFKVGNVYINRKITGALVGRQPFGGFGMSGVGSKAGGPDYLLQFMNPRSISENTLRRGFAPFRRDNKGRSGSPQ